MPAGGDVEDDRDARRGDVARAPRGRRRARARRARLRALRRPGRPGAAGRCRPSGRGARRSSTARASASRPAGRSGRAAPSAARGPRGRHRRSAGPRGRSRRRCRCARAPGRRSARSAARRRRRGSAPRAAHAARPRSARPAGPWNPRSRERACSSHRPLGRGPERRRARYCRSVEPRSAVAIGRGPLLSCWIWHESRSTLRSLSAIRRWSGLPRTARGGRARARRRAVREARVAQPRRQRQGPHRRRDDRGRRGRGPDRAGTHDDRRGDERQHRDRAGVRVRGEGLRAGADAAAGHEPRAREPAAAVRRAGADHGVARRDERGGRPRRGSWRAPGTCSCPTSSPTPRTPRRTGAPPAPRSSARWTDAPDVLVAGVGTGGTITGHRRVPARAQPGAADRRGRAAQLGGALRRAARRRTGFRASAPGSCRRCSTASCSTRCSPVSDEDAIQTAWSCARRTGLLAGISGGAALWAALQVAARAGVRAGGGSW